jgi:hypothetical protein
MQENCGIKNALFELQLRRHVVRDLSLRKAIAQNNTVRQLSQLIAKP